MPVSRRDQGIRQPQYLSPHFRRYSTSHYTLYDPKKGNVGPRASEPFLKYAQYDKYTLYMNPAVKRVEDIPTSGVRLDDMTIAFVLTLCTPDTLRANWPADFESHGWVRPTRMPLGQAAKFWKGVGEIDVDGNAVPEGGAGYYYKWWRGIHCLCGKEGEDDVYQRPCHERYRCPGVGFKVSSRAKIQLPSGDPEDPTFASSSAPAAYSSSTDSEPIRIRKRSRQNGKESSPRAAPSSSEDSEPIQVRTHSQRKGKEPSPRAAPSSSEDSEPIQTRTHLRKKWKSVQTHKRSRIERRISESQVLKKRREELD